MKLINKKKPKKDSIEKKRWNKKKKLFSIIIKLDPISQL
jgi:hypothetical protein